MILNRISILVLNIATLWVGVFVDNHSFFIWKIKNLDLQSNTDSIDTYTTNNATTTATTNTSCSFSKSYPSVHRQTNIDEHEKSPIVYEALGIFHDIAYSL